ncbi:MAG: leucine-rich repeat protein [Clostridia bacterium]|nr:leucine-rich repeat protein [Clostridia bacterium]
MKKISKIFLALLMIMPLVLQTSAVFALEILEEKTLDENVTSVTSEEKSNDVENLTLNSNSEELEKSENENKIDDANASEVSATDIETNNETAVTENITANSDVQAQSEETTDLEVDKEVETDVVGAEYYDGNVSYIYNEHWNNEYTLTVVARGKYITEATVPAYIRIDGVNRTVTRVDGFDGCTDLRKVTLPSTITTICDYAFDGCTSLTSINIPSSVKTIEDHSFRNCTSLRSISIPNSVETIERYAFINSGLVSVIIPNSVMNLGEGAFYNCSSLTAATLPKNISEIPSHIFNYTALKNISIPSKVTKIGHSAFANTKLQSVTIPQNVTEMISAYWSDEFGQFEGCSSLTTVNILGKITKLPTRIFKNCVALTNVTLCNTITSTGNQSFYNCRALKTISLPNNLTNVSIEMFYNCLNLTDIKLPNNLETVERSSFANCSKLTTISFPYKVQTLKGAYWSDEKGTFEGCNRLDSIYFTKSIQSIENDVFRGLDYCTIYGYDGSAAKSIADEHGYRFIKLNPVTSVKISGNKTVVRGNSTTLKATVGPTNAYQKGVIWTSSNTSVATVDGGGQVTGRKTGTTTITAMAKDGTGVRGTFNITVSLTDLPFHDVAGNAWYYNAVKYCYNNNIISGTTSTTFSPATQITRGMLVTILHRMEGSPKVSGTPKFKDVKNSKQYYYTAVKWASDKKIVSGYKNGNFGPNDPITREDLSVILYKYAKYKGKNLSKSNNLSAFSDRNKISSYALPQMKWAVGVGVITGNKNGTLNPRGTATRAEAAAMIQKYCQKVGR